MRRFVDSNVFIYVLLADPTYGRRALDILLRFEKGLEQGVTSTLVLSQVLAHLVRRGRVEAISKLLDYLEGAAFIVADTRREDFEEARKLREEAGVSWRLWDDLVLASQMRRLGIKEIYSNDRDFDLIPGVARLF